MDPVLMHQLIGLSTAGLVALLTVPAAVHVSKSKTRSGGGYIRLGDDNYEDRDGIATEDSIRAFSDTRPRVAVWLSTLTGLGAAIAAGVVAFTSDKHAGALSDLSPWAEPVCWVRLSSTLIQMS
jgi:hypothetical protein